MTRSLQDRNFLVWDVFATTGKHGFDENPNIVFQCMTLPESRPRVVTVEGTEADAQARIINASDEELLALLEQSERLP